MASASGIEGIPSRTDTAAAGQRPAAVVESQLATCKKQLADWVNCPSGKTAAGRAKIEAITTQIAKLKAQAEQTEQPTAPTPAHQAEPMTQASSILAWCKASYIPN